MAAKNPFVRLYNASTDFEDGLHVFLKTIQPGLDWEPARTVGSYLWYRAYVNVAPETCYVLDDGTGRVVGYCIGATDTTSFAQRWRDVFTPTIDPKLVPRHKIQTGDPQMEGSDVKHFRKAVYEADCSMLHPWPQMLEQYPAHLHIDILPEYQGKGWGKVLIQTLLGTFKSKGAKGVHLDMVQSNTGARAFYNRIGFQICPQILDDGASGQPGIDGIVVTLVMSF
ncbi:hypothetical protein G6011_08232 [Alternaria panax]|uniref:N-acetyltransferase domain-containing protein n=1 Tax=Alternaria panax TaxID=48097 RepID=A0AAD4FM79_9PLEO|nr:hypothetical protein G6011_08232 [Alternaria panax]